MKRSGRNTKFSQNAGSAPPKNGWRTLAALTLVFVLIATGCSRGGNDEAQEGNQDSFCRIVTTNDPVALASVEVLAQLAEVAPTEVDSAVDELLEAAERIAKLETNSKKQLALEFEIRFSDEYIGSRKQVEGYALANCRPQSSSTTEDSTDGENDDETDVGKDKDSVSDGQLTTTTTQLATKKG